MPNALITGITGQDGFTGQNEEGRILVVDHCHDTRKIRGLLHNNCNAIVGMSREDSALLLRIAEYVEEHRG